MTRSTRNAAILLLLLGTSVATLSVLDSGPFYRWQQRRMVERVLAADPEALLTAGRMLLASRAGYAGQISPSSPDVPMPIRRLKPTLIRISTNALGVDFSDAFNPFGIIVYATGQRPPAEPRFGRGPTRWIDGLWVYDDGQLETYGQQVGPANRSQPIRSETARPSSAGGARH